VIVTVLHTKMLDRKSKSITNTSNWKSF